MTKTELIKAITEKMNAEGRTTKQADVKALLECIEGAVIEELYRGNEVAWAGLGKFHTKFRAERAGRHPKTGKAITIPSAIVPAFSPYQALKDALN